MGTPGYSSSGSRLVSHVAIMESKRPKKLRHIWRCKRGGAHTAPASWRKEIGEVREGEESIYLWSGGYVVGRGDYNLERVDDFLQNEYFSEEREECFLAPDSSFLMHPKHSRVHPSSVKGVTGS